MVKRFLVTGGCGFIGSHLVEHLVQLGHSITVVDDLSSGSLTNLKDIIEYIEIVENRVELINYSNLLKFDGVFHLAAQSSVPLSVKNFYDSSSKNLLSTLKIIDLCCKDKIPLVYASSSAVYGNLPMGDEDGKVDLLSPYAADKLNIEIYSSIANELYGLHSYGLRFFNVYGPRQDPKNPYSGVISIFANRILKGQPLIINGGYQTRDFIYVTDVIKGLWSAYEFLLKSPGSSYSNLLSGVSISIDKLADTLMTISGISVEKQYRNLSPDDPEKSLGAVNRMRENLKLRHFVALEDGLHEVLTWMKTVS